jgi:serine/threonine protein kinase/Tfp pilus assembly protein PilF
MTEREIFIAALHQRDPAGRAAFLGWACGEDREVRGRVEELLREREQLGSFLESPAAGLLGAVEGQPVREGPGTVIGPYRLLEQIGEGGFGVVFLAEQTQPVRRKVALKVLKPGMDTRQVVARFEAERQALALMDHPNIAQVFDGGETPGGRPYFVMELVKGVPITAYCDQSQLTPEERLELFIHVCQAVQHAHQKGIIHRDLKPSNVLVTMHDRAVVKVIDFGTAKAIDRQLTEKTMSTDFDQMIGTPLYMSPEQAQMSGLDVDTRTDIYALGVLLYELLTGTTPFDKERFREAGYDELRRIIREEEPPRPSTRLSTLGQAAATVSVQRQSDPKRLSQLFQGELDWIVMKCLEKDRDRRYESSSALAADVERYLGDEPVLACPPSAVYRLGKLARRHKAALTIACVLAVAALVTLAGVGGSVGWALRDREARTQATEEAASAALAVSKRLQARGSWKEAREAVRRAGGLLARGQGNESLARQVRQQMADLGMVETLENLCLGMRVRGSVDDQRQADCDYAKAFREYGIDVEAVEPSVAINLLKASAIRGELASALDNWALACRDIRKQHGLTWQRLLSLADAIDPDPERRAIRDAWKRGDRKALAGLADSAAPALLQVPNVDLMADALDKTGATERAVALLKKAQQHQPGDFWINYLLCFYLGLQKSPQADEELRFAQAAVALRSDNAMAHNLLGAVLHKRRAVDEAIAEFQRAITLLPGYTDAHANLGCALAKKGKLDEAIACYHKALALNSEYANAHGGLGLTLMRQGQFGQAEKSLRRCLELPRASPPLRKLASQLLQQCQQLIDTDSKLKAYLSGNVPSTDAATQVQMAALAQQPCKRLYLSSVRLYRDALARQPQLAEAHRYNAACAAALAAGGKGQETGKLDDQERSRLRRQALDWLQADLKTRSQQLDQAKPEARPALLGILGHWLRDPDLEGLRDADSLARLPAEERAAWHKLWTDVRQRLGGPHSAP